MYLMHCKHIPSFFLSLLDRIAAPMLQAILAGNAGKRPATMSVYGKGSTSASNRKPSALSYFPTRYTTWE